MDDNVTAKVINGGTMSATDFSVLMDALSDRECMVINGCELTRVDESTIQVSPGYIMAFGRLIYIENARKSIAASTSGNKTKYISVAIATAFNPDESEVAQLYVSDNGFPSNSSFDVMSLGTCYCPIGKVIVNASGIISGNVYSLKKGNSRAPMSNPVDSDDTNKRHYVHFPNGLLICWGRRKLGLNSSRTICRMDVTYPHVYDSKPFVIASCQDWNLGQDNGLKYGSFVVGGVDLNSAWFVYRTPNDKPVQPNYTPDIYCMWFSIGYSSNFSEEQDT
jgi:hypothetical protein